jgi:glycosyltransferase involved in cell wall biosynthesis
MSFSFFIRIIKFFFSGVKIVVDVRDLTWLYINKNDKFFEKLISRTFEKICLFNIARADVVFVTNGYQKKYISSFNHNVITIQNGISREKHKILSNVNGGGITVDCIKILYAGNFGLLQNLFTILEAVRAFNCTQYQLYLVGNGADKDRIKNYVNQHRLNDRVFIFDSVSFGELVKFYEQCDIVYGQIINTKALKTAVPSKVFEYASLGKPIIYGIRGAGEDEIKKLAGVFVVEPENVLALSAVLEELLDSSLFARVVNEALSNVDYSSSNFVRENYESVCRETIVRLIND